jgi:hypothetical protein
MADAVADRPAIILPSGQRACRAQNRAAGATALRSSLGWIVADTSGRARQPRERRCRRPSLPLAVLEMPTMALRPTGVFVPPPETQQDHAQHQRNQQKFLHHTLTVLALTAVSNMRRATSVRQWQCCDKATKALLMSPKRHKEEAKAVHFAQPRYSFQPRGDWAGCRELAMRPKPLRHRMQTPVAFLDQSLSLSYGG